MSRLPFWVVLPFFIGLLGCSGSNASVPDEHSSTVRMFLDGYEDIREPRFLSRHFAAGKVPAKSELAKYAKYGIEVVDTPRMQGGKATVQVKILDVQGKEIAIKEWTLVKEGQAWKLENAPLP
ncbi:MAG: hypothetical protein SNJ75_00580 [Gemmataceae bacterium]